MDAEIALLAGRQHGVVGLRQLVALGLNRRAVAKRAAAGRLHRIHPGVYAVGHRRLSRQGWWMAAVLSGGEASTLSHRPAGAAWNLRAWNGRVAITVPTWRRGPAGIDVHASFVPADERTVLDGIPVMTYPRTIFDLASLLSEQELTRVVEEAEVMHLTDSLSLPAILERHRGERGAGRLRAVLASSGLGMGVTASEPEERFVSFLADLNLPHPELNATLGIGGRNFQVDCLWRRERLVVELIGLAFHGTRRAISRDTARNRRLTLAGYTVIEVTWAQLHVRAERAELARDLRAILPA